MQTDQFLSLLRRRHLESASASAPPVDRGGAVGFFAFAYEKVRNLVDYQEEHLLLRRAITRILIRRSRPNTAPSAVIAALVNELILARYLAVQPSASVLKQSEKAVARCLEMSRLLAHKKLVSSESPHDFFLSLAGREIEALISPSTDDYLINFALSSFETRVVWDTDAPPEIHRARLLVGLMRTLGRYDERTIYYKLWCLYFPRWPSTAANDLAQVFQHFDSADVAITNLLTEEIGEKVVLVLKRHIAPLEIAKDLINRPISQVDELFKDEDRLFHTAVDVARSRYNRAKAVLKRSAVNAFIYIFITKMVVAIALEVPYELLISRQVNYLPLGINLILPPLLMLLMALTVEIPTAASINQVANDITALFFHPENLSGVSIKTVVRRNPVTNSVFVAFYLCTFIAVFGLTFYLLHLLQYSIVSLLVFFFFLSTVSFFAFRIRSSYKELVVGEQDNNLISTIFDFLMLPFIKLGRLISTTMQGLNIFIFIFDIILEAPFKIVLEVVQDWLHFLREKKDEALNVIK